MQGRMSDVKWKFQMFENVLSNLLTKLVFHVEKPMNTVDFVDIESTDKILSQYQSNYKQLRQHIWKSPGFDSGCWKLIKKKTQTDRYTRCHELWVWKPQFHSLFKHCASPVIQSLMVCTAVNQQHQTGNGVHLAYSRMCTVSLSWGHIGWCVVLAIHQTLAPRLKKGYSYNSTPPFGHHDLF
jgi:hypothetical protein